MNVRSRAHMGTRFGILGDFGFSAFFFSLSSFVLFVDSLGNEFHFMLYLNDINAEIRIKFMSLGWIFIFQILKEGIDYAITFQCDHNVHR